MPTRYDKKERSRREWRGYTLDEIRYRRAIVSVKLEIEKDRIASVYQSSVGRMFSLGKAESGLTGKINSLFTMVDYGAMAYNLVKKMINIYKNIRN